MRLPSMLNCFPFLRRNHAQETASDASSITLCIDASNEKASNHGVEPPTANTSTAVKPVPTGDRLASLRRRMADQGVDLYIITSQDAHGSEYTAPRDQLRAFISGFTGSAGTVLVSQSFAGLWVDGRYHVQADQQTEREYWTVFKLGTEGVLGWEEWIKSKAHEKVGMESIKLGGDARLLPYTTVQGLLEGSGEGHELLGRFEEHSLVTDVWMEDFPTLYPPKPKTEVHQHEVRFAGLEAGKKIEKLVRFLRGEEADKLVDTTEQEKAAEKTKRRAEHYVVDQLDEVAWLLNLRASPPGIPNNPVFPAYVVVSDAESDRDGAQTAPMVTLFTSLDLFPEDSDVHRYLTKTLGLTVRGYNDVWQHLRTLSGTGRVVLSEKASYALIAAVTMDRSSILGPSASPLALWKSCKNATELTGMRNAYRRDGLAWARWASWLEDQIVNRKAHIDEHGAVLALEAERRKLDLYAGFEAYEAIAGTGENAASPHYETPEVGSARIDRKTPFLMDSGGQYLDGTIDTTRTVHFGKPTCEQKRAYTRVLQGHIALDSVVFPTGKTAGSTLDVLARRPLWSDGKDYLHGT